MIFAFLAGGAISVLLGAGATASSGLGEERTSASAVVRVESRAWRGEAVYDSSRKVDGMGGATGWIGRASVEASPGEHGLVGLIYQHRVGPGWSKDRAAILAGVRGADWRVWAQSALTDRDRVSGLHARVTVRTGRLMLEPQAGVVLYDQGASAPARRWGRLFGLRLLYALGGAR